MTVEHELVRVNCYIVGLESDHRSTDAVQSFIRPQSIFVDLEWASGLLGRGKSYTRGTGGHAVLVNEV